MKNKASILIFSMLLMLSFGSLEQVAACWCATRSVCERTNNANSIFVGKVLKATKINVADDNELHYTGRKRILLQIKESFSSETNKSTIEIETGGKWDCDYFGFKKNKSYLVFAYKYGKTLHTGRCGGTKPMKTARKDLKYLRALPDGNQNGKIFGEITQIGFDSTLKRYDSFWSAGIPFLLSGNGISRNFVTNSRGEFEFSNLKAGAYQLKVFMPSFYDFMDDGKDTSIREITLNGRGCARQFFSPEVKNSIEGRVVNNNGKPLSNIDVDLVAFAKFDDDDRNSNYSTKTDEKGMFIFKKIFPRRYLLGINIEEYDENEETKKYYPNTNIRTKAKVIEFGLGGKLKGYNLVWQKDTEQ